MRDALVGRDDESEPLGCDVAAHHRLVQPLDHLDDRALSPPAPVDTGHAREHAVAVHHRAHLARWQEQILATLLRHEKTEPVRVADHAPPDHVHSLRQAVEAAAVPEQLPVALHGAQSPAEGVAIAVALDAERLSDRIEG